MKKIAKLTWLHNGNYGSVLQALALQKFLLNNGYDVEDLNYNASLKTKLMNLIVNRNSPKLFLGKFKALISKKHYAHPEKFDLRNKRFEDFKNKTLRLGPICTSPGAIKKESVKYDVFICGSDQIWSPALMNPVFYLDFLPDDAHKIAYAPSFGVVDVSKRKKKQISKYLSSFDHISVRETQGKHLVEELLGKSVPVQVDPTMLISSEEWQEYIDDSIYKKEYIFCYLLTPNPRYIELVRKLSKEKNLPVVIVPTAKGPFDTGFEEYVEAGPAEWLSLIFNASFVCTDSFHGCIFSTIFHKEFLLFKRFSDTDKKSENSRVYTLTKMLNVEDRLVDASNVSSYTQLKTIDFKEVDRIIQRKAKDSGNWLLQSLCEVCK